MEVMTTKRPSVWNEDDNADGVRTSLPHTLHVDCHEEIRHLYPGMSSRQ
jgi:hypothetical protein